jgi:DNA-directed RNA polymerase specialized sigma24 family protein
VRRECHRLLRAMRGQVDYPKPDHPIFAYTAHPDLQSDLAAASQSLPDKYREAIILRDFEELSITDIAVQLRRTRAAVKSRIHRGREMMKEHLQD